MSPVTRKPSSSADDLVYEHATNRRYLDELARFLGVPVTYGLSRNEVWAGNLRSGKSYDVLGPLFGRVGLDYDDDLAGRSFYIGPRLMTRDGLTVFSWVAPVASVFFQPDASEHEFADRVVVRRTFTARLDDLVAIEDEWVGTPLNGSSPFALVRRPRVPTAPAPAGRRIRQATTPAPTTELAAVEVAHTDLPPSAEHERGMRARKTVLRALQAPRTGALTSVLATLQPDQYDIVTRTPETPLVVQGHPGTGKTIIAAHRAAYLVHPERDEQQLRRVLLLGPTPEYTRHVARIVQELDPDNRVTVKDLPTWLMEIAGLKQMPSGPLDGLSHDVEWFIGGLTERSARLMTEHNLWKRGTGARMANLRTMYGILKLKGHGSAALATRPQEDDWLATLPSFNQAILRRKYLPLFAQCGLTITRTPPLTDTFQHVIIDEAQDLTQLEWRIVDAFHRPVGGPNQLSWTILGDTNQRRTDHTYLTWQDLGSDLGLDDGINPIEPVVVKRGFRSTQRILDFASGLLPKASRGTRSLQRDGAPVTVTRATKGGEALSAALLREVDRLLQAYPDGTLAVIGVDLRDTVQALHKAGWKRASATFDSWTKDERRLDLRTPETARGVEWDAVIVLEPALFPANLARSGPLYTSLTRGNRELAIVHHQALPQQLRDAARR